MSENNEQKVDVVIWHPLRFRIMCSGPGAHLLSLNSDEHLLDVYLNGAPAEHSVRGEVAIDATRPPRSFSFTPAGRAREIRCVRSGRSLHLVLPKASSESLWSSEQPFSVPELENVHDPAMIGAAQVIFDHVIAHGEDTREDDVLSFAAILLTRLGHRATTLDCPEDSRYRPDAIQRVLEHIESNLSCRLRLADLAKIAGVSSYHFARLFRTAMAMSVHQYVLERRVARAEKLVANGTDGLADIAYRCGFGSQSHMTTVFRRLRGRTPGEIRRSEL